MADMFSNAAAYDSFMGRWSRRLAPVFVEFAQVRDGNTVLDVGCGTGILTQAIAAVTRSSEIAGVDPSPSFVEYARTRFADPRIRFDVGNALALPYSNATFDKCLALLVINLIAQPEKAVSEMLRVTRPGGSVAVCHWDAGGGMEMHHIFWEEASKLDPAAEPRRETHRPYSRQGQLKTLWEATGFEGVEETGLKIDLDFASFDDFWLPLLGGVGPPGSYLSSLPQDHQQALREQLRRRILGNGPDVHFKLHGQSWGVRGMVPHR
jgi:ubiquinone/menaquinone biosynthesis C-methylase UbiE